MPVLDVTRFDGLDPAVAAYMSALDFGRGRLVAAVKNLTPAQLEAKPTAFKNSVATLAVHVAATEVAFAYRIMGQQMPEELAVEFPPHRSGPLTEITGVTAEEILARLEKSRGILQEAVAGLTAADLTREIPLGGERVATVAWFLALLPYHVSDHVGHIQMNLQHQ